MEWKREIKISSTALYIDYISIPNSLGQFPLFLLSP